MENNNDKENQNSSKVAERKIDNVKAKNREQIYYSGLTILLCLALFQVGWSVVINFSKAVSFKSKMATLEKVKDASMARNDYLKNEIKAYSEVSKLEGIARNSLKMASEDEVLILINDNEASEKTQTTQKKGLILHKDTTKKQKEVKDVQNKQENTSTQKESTESED